MPDNFESYRRFADEESASELMELLDKNHIVYETETTETTSKDLIFVAPQTLDTFLVKLKPGDFKTVNDLLQQVPEPTINEERFNFLSEFEDNDLLEIIASPVEWEKGDAQIAEQLLKQRGKELTDDKIIELQKKKFETESKPKKGKPIWLLIGFISALLGGLFGILIGWHYYYSKAIDPNGNKFYEFDKATKKQGLIMFIIGIISFVLFFILISKLRIDSISYGYYPRY